LDEVDEFRTVDPGCGSGHFLTSVLEEIVNIRKSLYAQNESYPDEYRLKKTTVLNNIYGVDMMGPAVEIAKLRCWLSVISELETENVDDLAEADALALPNIAFNLREGNSLIGYTGFPEMNGDDQYRLGSFSEDTVRDRYQDIIDEIEKHEQAIDSETAEMYRRNAFEKLRKAREELIDDIHGDFLEAGIDDITPEMVNEMEPFNWVLEFAEVYADGGFDVVVGNPPWDVLAPNRDEFFSRYDAQFRGKSPDEKESKQEELLQDEEIRKEWEEYKRNFQRRADYFRHSDAYELQEPRIDGKIVPNNQNDLSALFLERVFSIARPDGYVSQVLPGNIFNGSNSKDVRLHMIDEAELKSIVGFVNNGIFPEIASKYQFGVVVLKNSGKTESIRGIFQQDSLDVLEDFTNNCFTIPRHVLSDYSPEARIFPQLTSEEEVGVLDSILKHKPLGRDDGDWFVDPYRELDKYKDGDRYVEDKSKADYPVLGGRNIYQFVYDWGFLDYLEPPELWSVEEDENPELSAKRRMREKGKSRLKTAIYDEFGGTGSQKAFVDNLLDEERGEGLKLDDVLLDCTDYRIVLRNIARSTDERTLIASIIPPGVVCHHAISTVRNYGISPNQEDLSKPNLRDVYEPIFTDEQMLYCLGILNSIPFDFLMRTKVDSNIVQYKLEESQVPRLSHTDDNFKIVSDSAARLNCFGEEFEEMRNRLGGIEPVTDIDKRREVQAELDAAAFHAYGLDYDQTEFVLEDFHRVQSPRLMNEAYFEMVLEKYEELAE
jgi:hypothetical protein